MRQEVCQRGRIHFLCKVTIGVPFFLLYMYHAGAIFDVSKMGGDLRLDFALNISCNFLQEAQHLYIAFFFSFWLQQQNQLCLSFTFDLLLIAVQPGTWLRGGAPCDCACYGS